ncbi:MAG: BamA/TamA family outer membrane protein [Spirochaetes bacterium]|nr:BamA/TamA family outer membrane protein [Spirochaetota bacterium]
MGKLSRLASWGLLWGAMGLAQAAPVDPPAKPDPYEWKIFPVLGGNSDIGFQFGVLGIVTRLGPPELPYLWTLRIQGSLSVKGAPLGGVEFPVHEDFIFFDGRHPGGRLRYGGELKFSQAANAGYYGLGNASAPPLTDPLLGTRVNQYLRSELSAYFRGGWALAPTWNLLFGLGVRRLAPTVYPGSLLERDIAREALLGGISSRIDPVLLLGFERDCRDSELVPSRGHQVSLGLRGVPGAGLPGQGGFVGVSLHARLFLPIWKKYVVLALRELTDLLLGNPPLHDLSRATGFETTWMLGGSDGVRGVPEGRIQGRIRSIGNIECRVMPARFTLFGQRFETGFTAFLDAGRAWADWKSRSDLDGEGLGLHWGTGLGWRLRWGESVLIRMDFAYAPEAAAADPGFPIGIYFDLGHSF